MGNENTRRSEANLASIGRYFDLLARLEISEWIRLWAAEATHVAPFAPPGGPVPRWIQGREAIHEFYNRQAANYANLSYPGTELFPTLEPDIVVARWYPTASLVTGESYSNENVGIFEFDIDGRILRLTEYFDPRPLTD